MMKYLIRKASVDDVAELRKVTRREINSSYRLFLGDDAVEWLFESGVIEQYISRNLNNCCVLITDNQIVGLCLCRANLIDLIIVDDESNHHGYGSLLLKYCEDCLFEDFEELELETLSGYEKAKNLYLKHGWKEKEQYSYAYPDVRKLVFVKRKMPLAVSV